MTFLAPAVRILLAWRRDPRSNLKLLLQRALDRRADRRQNDEISRTVYGVARRQIALGEALARLSSRPPGQIDDETAAPLLAGLFLLLGSDSYPDYAAVNESVRVAPPRSRPFVNAVLRAAARRRGELRLWLESHPDPGVRHSMSPLLVRDLARLSARVEDDLAYLDREPVFHLRPRPGTAAPAIAAALQEAGIGFRCLPLPGCLETAEAGGVRRLLEDGLPAYFQNSGSQFVALVAAEHARSVVWDLAAAPGSKTLALASLRPDALILASDRRLERLPLLRSAVAGLPGAGIVLFAADAARPPLPQHFEGLILADLPCTASGTLRKNPDLKSRIGEERLAASCALQAEIVAALLQACPRATILYSVCSFLAAETDELLATVLSAQPFRSEPLAPLAERHGFLARAGDHGIYLMPGPLNNDIFYLSLLRRVQ